MPMISSESPIRSKAAETSFNAFLDPNKLSTTRLVEMVRAPIEAVEIADLAKEKFKSSAEVAEYRKNIDKLVEEVQTALITAQREESMAQSRISSTIKWLKGYYNERRTNSEFTKNIQEAMTRSLRGDKATVESLLTSLLVLKTYILTDVDCLGEAPISPESRAVMNSRNINASSLTSERLADIITELRSVIEEHQFLSKLETLGTYLPWISGKNENDAAKDLITALDGVTTRTSKKGFLKKVLSDSLKTLTTSAKTIETLNGNLEGLRSITVAWSNALSPIEEQFKMAEAEIRLKEELERRENERKARAEELLRIAEQSDWYVDTIKLGRMGGREREYTSNLVESYKEVPDTSRRLIIDNVVKSLAVKDEPKGLLKIFFEGSQNLQLINLLCCFVEAEISQISELEPSTPEFRKTKERLEFIIPRIPEKQRKELEKNRYGTSWMVGASGDYARMLTAKSPRVLSWDEAAAAAEI